MREPVLLTWVPYSGTLRAMDWSLIKRRIVRTKDEDLASLSRESGVPHGTLWNIKHGLTKNPRVQTFEKLVAHFKRGVA